MKDIKRVFLFVVDSMGCGYAPDADRFGDVGANTLKTISQSPSFHCPNMEKIGLFAIDGFKCAKEMPSGSFGRFEEVSAGKDTTAGHWEIAGLVMPKPFPTYPEGFPEDVIRAFEEQTGRGTLCNKPYSGTEVIRDYGEEHLQTGKLIVYTSADSVFQIAAHEDIVPPEELYRYCRIAREILQGEHGVGRVIARPFIGSGAGDFERVSGHRHDFSLVPPYTTILDELSSHGLDSIGVGKIRDIFAGKGLETVYTTPSVSNADGMDKTIALMDQDFTGLCFVNLVETDSIYGHRRDIEGYAAAVSAFDVRLGEVMAKMQNGDVVMITADHGCDPGFGGTDHTREYIPFLVYGKHIAENVDLGTRRCFGDIGATILDMFDIPAEHISGSSFLDRIRK